MWSFWQGFNVVITNIQIVVKNKSMWTGKTLWSSYCACHKLIWSVIIQAKSVSYMFTLAKMWSRTYGKKWKMSALILHFQFRIHAFLLFHKNVRLKFHQTS